MRIVEPPTSRMVRLARWLKWRLGGIAQSGDASKESQALDAFFGYKALVIHQMVTACEVTATATTAR